MDRLSAGSQSNDRGVFRCDATRKAQKACGLYAHHTTVEQHVSGNRYSLRVCDPSE